MACPSYAILEQNLTFTVQAYDSAGAPVDTDSLPTYSVYEDETGTAIVTGTMAKLDDAGTTGFYSEQLAVTTANGYERYKTYTVRIVSLVDSVAVAKSYSFICLAASDTVTATTSALTTVGNVQDYADIAGDDTLLGYLINRATSAIQRFCGRDLVETTYREVRDGDGTQSLLVYNAPIISVQMVGVGLADAFAIKNTSSDAYNAYIQISSSSMTLVVQGGTNAGSSSFTLSDYSTFTALLAAINALGTGWETSAITALAAWSPTELLPCTGLSCLNGYVYPSIPDDLIGAMRVDAEKGEIVLTHDYFYAGTQNIVIRYTGGYATTPAALEQICIDLVLYYYHGRKQSGGLDSEKLGDYAYTRSDTSKLPAEIRERLMPWVRIGF